MAKLGRFALCSLRHMTIERGHPVPHELPKFIYTKYHLLYERSLWWRLLKKNAYIVIDLSAFHDSFFFFFLLLEWGGRGEKKGCSFFVFRLLQNENVFRPKTSASLSLSLCCKKNGMRFL